MSSGGESLSYFPLSFKEALHLEVIYAGMGHQSQELRGSLFRLPVRMAQWVSLNCSGGLLLEAARRACASRTADDLYPCWTLGAHRAPLQ